MITDIKTDARQITLRNVALVAFSTPFIVVGYAIGLIAVVIRVIFASIRNGYRRALRLLE